MKSNIRAWGVFNDVPGDMVYADLEHLYFRTPVPVNMFSLYRLKLDWDNVLFMAVI